MSRGLVMRYADKGLLHKGAVRKGGKVGKGWPPKGRHDVLAKFKRK